MAEKNKFSRYLCHMTPAEKKAYNARYYQEHKDEYWGVGKKSGRQKYIAEGGTGVKRRGNGLGTGPVGVRRGTKRSVDSTGAVNSWSNLVNQTGTPLQSYAYDQAMGNPTASEPPPMTYEDLDIYLTSTLLDNAINNAANAANTVAKGAKSAGKKIAKQLMTDWKVGARAISSLFKKKRR